MIVKIPDITICLTHGGLDTSLSSLPLGETRVPSIDLAQFLILNPLTSSKKQIPLGQTQDTAGGP